MNLRSHSIKPGASILQFETVIRLLCSSNSHPDISSNDPPVVISIEPPSSRYVALKARQTNPFSTANKNSAVQHSNHDTCRDHNTK